MMDWDPNLDGVKIVDGKVTGLLCARIVPTDLVDGDVYYRILSATFIGEEAAQGRHNISVDVVDERGQRINGARVFHGWPTHRLPEFDERIEATVWGSVLAEWALYEDFDAWSVVGPYWVQAADGKSDTFFGAGLPWNRHVCFAIVFERTIYHAEPVYTTLDEALRAGAQAAQVIQFNPDAALQRRIFADGFVPNSPEFAIEYATGDGPERTYVCQRAEHLGTGVCRCYYSVDSQWDVVQFIAWRP